MFAVKKIEHMPDIGGIGSFSLQITAVSHNEFTKAQVSPRNYQAVCQF
jgi:hypothetical protein